MPSQHLTDTSHMRRALRIAERGWGMTAPNPMVGAVVVRDGRRVGEGFHAAYGKDHAEVAALNAAGDAARGATLYVTLEPCNHRGQTPPCASAIIDSGIARVIFATADPNPAAAGGAERLRAAGIQVESGLEEAAARELNAAFVAQFGRDTPWVTLKLALSLDGALADQHRAPGWLTSERSRREVHRMRAAADAVAVGLGTVLADDPALTVRHRVRVRTPPVRIVFARSGVLPTTTVLAQTAARVPTWLITARPPESDASELEQLGVRVLRARDLPEALRLLGREGIRSVLIEGGVKLTTALLDAGLVDRLTIFRAPILLGGAGGSGAATAFAQMQPVPLTEAQRLRVIESRMLDGDHMATYALTQL